MMTMENTDQHTDEDFRAAARRLYPKLEIELDAAVSTAPDGAYVEAWIWVDGDQLEQKGDSRATNA